MSVAVARGDCYCYCYCYGYCYCYCFDTATTNRTGLTFARQAFKMPIIEKPHWTLKVEQTKSAFAEGNARW